MSGKTEMIARVAEWRRKFAAAGCVLERVDRVGLGLLDSRDRDVGAVNCFCRGYYALIAGTEKGRRLVEMWRKPAK